MSNVVPRIDMRTAGTGSPNGGAGAVSGNDEFVVLGLPIFLRGLNTSFDI